MSSKASVPGTRAVRETPLGPVRVAHSASPPACSKCGGSQNVVRLWHGGQKMWVCRKHYKITSTKTKEATLAQRLLHRLPQPDEFELAEVLPNRTYRRRRTR